MRLIAIEAENSRGYAPSCACKGRLETHDALLNKANQILGVYRYTPEWDLAIVSASTFSDLLKRSTIISKHNAHKMTVISPTITTPTFGGDQKPWSFFGFVRNFRSSGGSHRRAPIIFSIVPWKFPNDDRSPEIQNTQGLEIYPRRWKTRTKIGAVRLQYPLFSILCHGTGQVSEILPQSAPASRADTAPTLLRNSTLPTPSFGITEAEKVVITHDPR